MAWVAIGVAALALAAAGIVAMAARTDDDKAPVRITDVAGSAGGAASPSATASPPPATPPPSLTPAPTPPPRSLFADQQIVAYYGNPYSPIMGILGEHSPEELVRRLRDQAARYQALTPDKQVVPALHLVYAVAQGAAGDDGSFLYHMPDELVEQYIELTRREGMLFIIDLQMGRADPIAETQRVLRWLTNEHVHLAVDPEFTMPPGRFPGVDLGSMDAAAINGIQGLLQQVALDAGVANKILIVHQFQGDMITNKAAIAPHDRVDVVIDLDGWGPPWSKIEKYLALATNEPVEYTGFKLFYRWDKPIMTEAEVLRLVPRPNVIVYQ
ncbi:MAG: hypothetical protein ACRDJE_14760 [Dehalococcoidia bacterium]